MANSWYTLGKQHILAAEVDLEDDDIRAILIDTADYTVDLDTDEYLDDIPGAARVATSGDLANKTITGGVFDADNKTISSVSGDSVEAIVLYKHTGTESTSILLFYMDEMNGLPFTPDGTDVTVNWPSGAYKIMSI